MVVCFGIVVVAVVAVAAVDDAILAEHAMGLRTKDKGFNIAH
jgi:hypothetical protein